MQCNYTVICMHNYTVIYINIYIGEFIYNYGGTVSLCIIMEEARLTYLHWPVLDPRHGDSASNAR